MKIMNSREFTETALCRVMNRGKIDLTEVCPSVRNIVADVRQNGDEALLRYTEKFDKVRLTASELIVNENEIKEAYKKLEKKQVNALKKASRNIARFHKKQLRLKWSTDMAKGVTAGQITKPLESVGVYAPGGKAVYPSSLLMCAVPARVVGVEKILVCTPPGENGRVSPALLVAADLAEATKIYRVGGAQGIAAMAYGTETIPKVDKIIGPGNIFVAAAKLEVNKDVAIDIPAGPSEILIIADETASPAVIASDLLAQAEHDPQAWTLLVTTSEELAETVKAKVAKQAESLPRTTIIEGSIKTNGLIVTVKDLNEAVGIANEFAPEHLVIQTKSPEEVFAKVRNAGSVFLGEYSPVAFGDYSSGLNHVLPTGGYAKFYSGLSTRDFVKTINFLKCSRQGYENLKQTTMTLARLEGLEGHARSVSIREAKTK